MNVTKITEAEILKITAELHSWKSPGVDKVHNFWYKKLTIFHKAIAKSLTDIIFKKQNIPNFMATGITYMIPKGKFSPDPAQYRPITCLPTIYKILTSVITFKITTHIEKYNIVAEEQIFHNYLNF